MEIILGKTAGFCYGVRNAVEGARKELQNAKENLYCLGEIVHNKQVVEDLKQRGLVVINNIEEAHDKVIIRAHGVAKKIYETAKQNNIEIKDFTCPNVLKIHKIAEEYQKQGYYIMLCGNKNHPENIGTLSYCGEFVSVIESEDDVEKAIEEFRKNDINKLLLIVQTTYSMEKFENIKNMICDQIPDTVEIEVKNTICRATELRQKETEEIAKKVDYMIIIGGANSSNTKKLYEISKKYCKNSICIETAKDLVIKEIKDCEKIGIMAGASTPQSEIQKVYDIIKL